MRSHIPFGDKRGKFPVWQGHLTPSPRRTKLVFISLSCPPNRPGLFVETTSATLGQAVGAAAITAHSRAA